MKTCFKTLLLLFLSAVCTLAMADPPGRVGRLSLTEGTVYFRNAVSGESGPAEINWPLTSQNVITTERGARAELRVGSTAIRVGSDSELEITQLDDNHFKLYLARGTINLRVKSRETAQDFELQTQQGSVLLNEPSRIRVDSDHGTAISVWSGSIRFASPDSNLTVRSGKRVEFVNGDIRMSELGSRQAGDEFDAWALARDQRDDQAVSARYISPEATGYEELDQHGIWQETTEYGAVWYPRSVPVDWAPYRAGRWTWVEPWGWTWVDSLPWGYAPSHYGRWVQLRNRWCWAPGLVTPRPVWAPALVGWVGGHNWSVSFSSGAAPAVGWFPLAPREMYVPSYNVSPTYIRQINITHVTNITNVTNIKGIAHLPPQVNYQNRFAHNALTVVPAEHFKAGRMVVVKAAPPVLPRVQQLQAAPLSPVVPAAIARGHGVSVIAVPPAAAIERRRGESGHFRASAPPVPQQVRPPVLQPAPVMATPLPPIRGGHESAQTPLHPMTSQMQRPEERPVPKIEHPHSVGRIPPAQHPVQPQPPIEVRAAPPERQENRHARAGRHEGAPPPQPQAVAPQPQALMPRPPAQPHPQPAPVDHRVKHSEHQRGEPLASSPGEAPRSFSPHHPERGGR